VGVPVGRGALPVGRGARGESRGLGPTVARGQALGGLIELDRALLAAALGGVRRVVVEGVTNARANDACKNNVDLVLRAIGKKKNSASFPSLRTLQSFPPS
jgi:hypothetical protein